MSKIYSFILILLFATANLFAQYTLSGKVTDSRTGEVLAGANVFIKSISTGAATNADGSYAFKVNKGQYTVTCSYIGFEQQEVDVNVTGNMELNFALKDFEFSLSVTVIADRAKERETPVAFSNVEKKDVELMLGSQDIPMALNLTPSLYATMQGGGAGDARVNVRGFNQKNVAIMINGVPVNDMENGWVYWSNWDGVGDATSSIQVQRGLSAVNLAAPSIGGTMNVITDPTAQKFGVKYKQEFGNDQFFKSTLVANTGLIDGKWAVNFLGVRKVGDGLIDKTWTDAWAYYLGAAYNINDNNRIELYALGAPQQHGQNLYKLNLGNYSHKLANELAENQRDYDPAALTQFKELGRKYNPTWNVVDPSYNSKVYWGGTTHERHSTDFINERENFYHKPIVNLNWYSKLSDMASVYTTVYYSGGTGGGTGTYGSPKWDYSNVQRVADWNATIAANRSNLDSNGVSNSKGILRNSVNQQWTVGAISKAYVKLNDNLTTSIGVDWRTAEIEHFYEVRDLLGGQYFYNEDNDFNVTEASKIKRLGDKVNYYNTNTVDWIGFYGQAEYSEGPFTAFGMYGWSTIKYSYTDHFHTADTLLGGKPDISSGELKTTSPNINGFQVKGGLSYRATESVDVYANIGHVEKVPIFDFVIDDIDGSLVNNPENEKFTSFEIGVNYHSPDRKFTAKVNYYNTLWKDRSVIKDVVKYVTLPGETNSTRTEGILLSQNVKQRHTGLEIESSYQPIQYFRLDASLSFGNWEYLSDALGKYKPYERKYLPYWPTEETLYIKDIKVGDAPQTQATLALSVFPVEGWQAQFVMKSYRDYYADFDPITRTIAGDRAQSWRAPAYTVFDFHTVYDLPIHLEGVDFQLFAHVFNVFDALYIQDAVDNSSYNAYSANGLTHSADDAEVYLGLPRTFNVGVTLRY